MPVCFPVQLLSQHATWSLSLEKGLGIQNEPFICLECSNVQDGFQLKDIQCHLMKAGLSMNDRFLRIPVKRILCASYSEQKSLSVPLLSRTNLRKVSQKGFADKAQTMTLDITLPPRLPPDKPLSIVRKFRELRWLLCSLAFNCPSVEQTKDIVAAVNEFIYTVEKRRPRKLAVFVNPLGGRKRAKYEVEHLFLPVLKFLGLNWKVIESSDKQPRDYIMSPDILQHDALICAGGDGFVQEVVNWMMVSQNAHLQKQPILTSDFVERSLRVHHAPIGMIPVGSTNCMYFSTNGNLDIQSAIVQILLGITVAVDVGSMHIPVDNVSSRFLSYRCGVSSVVRESEGCAAAEVADGNANSDANGDTNDDTNGDTPSDAAPTCAHVAAAPSTAPGCALLPRRLAVAADAAALDLHTAFCLERFFVTLCGHGFLGQVQVIGERLRALGPTRYHLSGLAAVLQNKVFRAKVCYGSSDVMHSPYDQEFCHSRCHICYGGAPQLPDMIGALEINSAAAGLQLGSIAAPPAALPRLAAAPHVVEGNFISVNLTPVSCRTDNSFNGMSPACHLGDGTMDLMLLRPVSVMSHARVLFAIQRGSGEQFRDDRMDAHRVDWLSLQVLDEERSVFNVDGEIVEAAAVFCTSHRQLLHFYGGINV